MKECVKFSDYRVAPACADDIPEMTELLALLFNQESEFTPDPPVQERGLRMIIADPSAGQIFVLKHVESMKVCGMVGLLFSVSTALGGRVAMLEDMVISPEYRNMGLGSLLINEAVQFAERQGLLRVSLLTDSCNCRAVSFYLKNCFKSSEMIVLRKML